MSSLPKAAEATGQQSWMARARSTMSRAEMAMALTGASLAMTRTI